MLVLTRRPDEEFTFPGLNITVKVLSVSGNKIRIGIDAPQDISVVRREVLERDEFLKREAESLSEPSEMVTPKKPRKTCRKPMQQSSTVTKTSQLKSEPPLAPTSAIPPQIIADPPATNLSLHL